MNLLNIKFYLLFFLFCGLIQNCLGQFKRIASYSFKDIVIENSKFDVMINDDTIQYLLSSESHLKLYNQKGFFGERSIPKGFTVRTLDLIQIGNDVSIVISYNSFYNQEDTSKTIFHNYTLKNNEFRLIDSFMITDSYVFGSYRINNFIFFNLAQSLAVYDIVNEKMTYVKVPKSKRSNEFCFIQSVSYLNDKFMLLTYGGEYYEIPKEFNLQDTFELGEPDFLLESLSTPIGFKRNKLQIFKEGEFRKYVKSNTNYYVVDYDNVYYSINKNYFFIVSFNKVTFYSFKRCKIKKINEVTFAQDFYGSIMSYNFFKVREDRIFFDTYLIEENKVVIYELLWR